MAMNLEAFANINAKTPAVFNEMKGNDAVTGAKILTQEL